jgi:hypothetical protein
MKRAGWLGCVEKRKRGRGEGEGGGLALGWAVGKGGKGFAFLEMFPNQFNSNSNSGNSNSNRQQQLKQCKNQRDATQTEEPHFFYTKFLVKKNNCWKFFKNYEKIVALFLI